MSTFEQTVEALKAGKAVIFPTDTVYGLGVAVEYARSPEEIFALKLRDASKPIAWLVGGIDDLQRYGRNVSPRALQLTRLFWPGALTLIVKASDAVPPAFRSKSGTIGLRMPANETALALIREVGPLSASSANRSGHPAPHAIDDIAHAIRDNAAAVIEDDAPKSGTASTVIDCSKGDTVIVRQGDVMSDQIFSIPIDFTSCDGESRINAKLWTSTRFGAPDLPGIEMPKAVIQIVHGMAEYIDRYDDLAEYLVTRGFVVCAEDHIGHGKSVGEGQEYGHMPPHGGKDILLGDVHTLHQIVRALFPDVPYVLYGHSMGSFITRAYIARYGSDLAACVLSGTGNVAAPLSRFGNALARAMASMYGETYRSKLIDNMGAGAYGKQIKNARTSLDWLSTDEKVVDDYMADDLCGFMFTVGGYATLLDLTAEVVTTDCAARVPKELPVFFVAGDGDPVGEMGKGVHAAAQLLRDAGVQRVDEKIYAGMRHEIHNEIGREQVYDDVADWIEARVG